MNGSLEAAKWWAAGDASVALATVPVVAGPAEAAAKAALRALPEPPDLFLSLGEAGPEPVVRLEKVAVNWDDFRIPDNGGNAWRDRPIQKRGPAARLATVEVARIADDLAGKTPLTVVVSLSAGAFLCNHLAYRMLGARLPCPYCFVHVPCWRPHDGEALLSDLVDTLAILRREMLRYTVTA